MKEQKLLARNLTAGLGSNPISWGADVGDFHTKTRNSKALLPEKLTDTGWAPRISRLSMKNGKELKPKCYWLIFFLFFFQANPQPRDVSLSLQAAFSAVWMVNYCQQCWKSCSGATWFPWKHQAVFLQQSWPQLSINSAQTCYPPAPLVYKLMLGLLRWRK